jgi:hypothetical protein
MIGNLQLIVRDEEEWFQKVMEEQKKRLNELEGLGGEESMMAIVLKMIEKIEITNGIGRRNSEK